MSTGLLHDYRIFVPDGLLGLGHPGADDRAQDRSVVDSIDFCRPICVDVSGDLTQLAPGCDVRCKVSRGEDLRRSREVLAFLGHPS
jgi:hypothetical protein